MREKWLRVSGARVHYWEAGEGPPLLLLPSASGRAVEYHALMPLLAPGARVFALDYPGFGQSDALPHIQSTFDLAVFVDAWRRAVGLEKYTVAGFSMGGWVALWMALTQSARIDRLVLLATSSGKDPDVPLISPAGLGFKEILNRFYSRPSVRETLVRQKLSRKEKQEIHRSTRAFNYLVSHGRVLPALQDRLCEINLPTLIIGALEDRVMPLFYQKQLHAGIPKSELLVLSECGHVLIAERPRDVAEAMTAFFKTA